MDDIFSKNVIKSKLTRRRYSFICFVKNTESSILGSISIQDYGTVICASVVYTDELNLRKCLVFEAVQAPGECLLCVVNCDND